MGAIANVACLDDLTLINRAASGDVAAFDVLMRRYNQRIYRVTRSILHDEAQAEEAAQDAWWKAYTHLKDFRGQAKPTTWLTRIAVNEALMRLRRNKSRDARIQSMYMNQYAPDALSMDESTAATPQSLQPDHQAWNTELRGLIEEHIDALPDIYRSVFMLRGVEEMPANEVATVLDLPEATVRVRFMRARRLLQQALTRELGQRATEAFSFAGERCDRIVAGVHARMRAAGIPDA